MDLRLPFEAEAGVVGKCDIILGVIYLEDDKYGKTVYMLVILSV